MAKVGKNKYIFGTVKMGERGQIVIPLKARKLFNMNPGDLLLVAGDIEKGLAVSKVEGLKGHVLKMLSQFNEDNEPDIESDIKSDEDSSDTTNKN